MEWNTGVEYWSGTLKCVAMTFLVCSYNVSAAGKLVGQGQG